MKDFFNQFRDNLERRAQPAFEEKHWQAFEQRLDREGEKRPAVFPWQWLAWPLLFLSLGANALLLTGLKKDFRPNTITQVKNDTVFSTQTIYKTDTVYRTRILRARHFENWKFPESLTPQSSSLAIPAKMPGVPAIRRSENRELSESLPLPSGTLSPLPNRPAHALRRLPTAFVLQEIPTQPTTLKQRKTIRHYLYALRPKGFRLSIAGGLVFPFMEGLRGQGGFSTGIEANIVFSPNLRMWTGVNYSGVRFAADRMDEAIGVPPVTPPSDDFVFEEAEALQPALEYGIGMQYFFNDSGRLKPFVGLGYGAVSLLSPYEVVYDFGNKPLGIEWSFEKNVGRNLFLTNLLLLRAGFEYEMSKNWHWQLRATYRTHFEKTGFQSPDVLGIQAGLMRRF